MHWHECNTQNHLFNFRKTNKGFPYAIFPVKKTNVGKVLKLWKKFYLNILSIHILKLEISGCDTNESQLYLERSSMVDTHFPSLDTIP
jgi:hypothetical protein